MARIGIDATTVSVGGKGHSRTQRCTVEALAELGVAHDLVAFVRTDEAAELLRSSGVRCVRTDHRLTLWWEQVGLYRARRRHGLDLLLTWTERLPVVGAGSCIIWLFELPAWRIEQNRLTGASRWNRASDLVTRLLWRRSLRRATVVLTGSEATSAELEEALPGLDPRPRALYPGLDPEFDANLVRARKDLFHLGSSDPRDNTGVVLEAYALVRQRVPDPPPLIIAGGLGPRADDLRSLAIELGVGDDVHMPGRVSDEQLAELYASAVVYVDPTLYEGFGYQVLEAMASGAPVVASNTTSIPEVVGEAGLLCDPRSPGAFADAIARVLSDPELADELARRGRERAALFTWGRTARSLATTIEEALLR